MKWLRNRCLPVAYLTVLVALAVIGCTSKQDPSEVLPICGNHSCGELVMVTTDTSSDGYHYLNPKLSPNGEQIAFNCDWWALPSDPRYIGDDYFVNYRQVGLIPKAGGGAQPATSLGVQGAKLVRIEEFSVRISGRSDFQRGSQNFDKGSPVWEGDTHLIFPIGLRVGSRLFRADVGNPALAPVVPIYMEPTDAQPSPLARQHLEPTLSADRRWLAFTRSGCAIPDSFETCTGLAIYVIDMSTATANEGYGARVFPVTREYSRIETPSWSPDGARLVFSGGMDLARSTGVGTELFTIDFDTTGLAAGTMPLDRSLKRLTYTARTAGDPISGILNTSPVYSNDGGTVYFVSTRRAPSVTLHDRNIWRMPADGSRDPEIYFFTRSDDVDPSVNPDGSLLFSSTLGFPTSMLDRLEDEAYQTIFQLNQRDSLGLADVQMHEYAAGQRRLLAFFEGVMSHLYFYRP